MKQFFKKLAIFLGVTVLFYPILVFVWFQWINPKFGLSAHWPETFTTYNVKYLKTLKKEQKWDFINIGSSHAYCSFNPEVYEENQIKMISLASPSQNPALTQIMLKKFLPIYKPKYVLYEVYPGPLVGNGLEASIDFAFNFPFENDFKTAGSLYFYFKELRVLNGIFYNLLANALGMSLKAEIPKSFIKGYNKENKKVQISKRNIKNNQWNFKGSIPEFEENLRIIQSYKITPILVYAPIPAKIYQSYSNNSEVENYIQTVAQKFNIKFFNFNKLENVFHDDEHFFDFDGHLNYEGGLIFNKMLIDSLKKDEIIQ